MSKKQNSGGRNTELQTDDEGGGGQGGNHMQWAALENYKSNN